ncbi:helix-turn-helix transcriptional regulator [Micromonospora sp. WMMD1082]|uniref:helix-turn-helix domain-containing protein n=1 Tax=Micromonospora sp. WMMD1082 TaxID=3016104 RepID=UPI0024160A6D|nr:helix-turn-helix transcriptional regulator [Micromonospora sp. WMMD1082]MDG4793826.1 helix-turn-helix transcriptional regulator [Micromonospora sp. WMMD1082]
MVADRRESGTALDHIGVRVRRWRLKRNLSQRVLADLAGLSQGYIAQIEAGTAPLDKRSTQLALTKALQISLADLTGQPYDPTTLEHATAARHLPALRAAIAALAFGSTDAPEDGPSDLADAVRKVTELHNACHYDDLVAGLPSLLLALSGERDDPASVRRLVWVTYAATFAAKYLGHTDLAMLAAQQCRAVAALLTDEPEWLGLAEFAVVHTLPAESKALPLQRAVRAIDLLEMAADHPHAGQVHGMLHLSAAMLAAVGGDAQASRTHLHEARASALRLGEGNFGQLWFGPTNVEIWRLGVLAELGDGGAVVHLPGLDVSTIGSSNRRATMYADLGRCLAQTRKHDGEAVAALLRAETIAPQRVRLSPLVRETVGSMLRRARRSAGGRDLQALAARLGAA